MENIPGKVRAEVEKFIRSNNRYKGAIILLHGESIVVGEPPSEVGRVVRDVVSLIDTAFRRLLAGSPRYFVAEGEGFGISYGKFGFDEAVVLVHSELPIGVAMYDVKNLCRTLSALAQ